MGRATGKGSALAAVAGLVALLCLHLDLWRPLEQRPWFGWMPEELFFRLLWMGLAWLYLLWFTTFVWEREGE